MQRKNGGTYTYTTAYNAITVQLSDRYHLHPDTPNAFGTFLRFTNSLGNQVLDGSDGSLPLYVIDHFTGYGWYISPYIDTFANALSMAANSTQHGFTDWRIPSPEEGLTIANVQDTNDTFDHFSADPDGLFNLGFNLFTNMPSLDGSSSWFIANSSVAVDSLQLIGSNGSGIAAPYFMIRNHY